MYRVFQNTRVVGSGCGKVLNGFVPFLSHLTSSNNSYALRIIHSLKFKERGTNNKPTRNHIKIK